MSFICTVERAALAHALQRLQAIADDRHTMPILSGVMMRADAAGFTLESTDLDSVVRVTIPATIDQHGEAVALLHPMAATVRKMEAGSLVELRGDNGGAFASGAPTYGKSSLSGALKMIAGRFRVHLNGFKPSDWPAIKPAAPAFSFAMPAALALDMLASLARDCKVPADKGQGADDLGARLVLASNGMTWFAGRSHSITRRRYPLPRLLAHGLAFTPKPGADIAADFTADALASLAKMITKPGKAEGEGPPVTFAFGASNGEVSTLTIEAGGVSATVKARAAESQRSRLSRAAALFDAAGPDWCSIDAARFSADMQAAAKAGEGLGNVALVADGDGLAVKGRDMASPQDGAAVLRIMAADELPTGWPVAALARACAGADRVTLALAPARGAAIVRRGDGVDIAMAVAYPTAEKLGAERFARDYGAAWAARDGEAMAAAVAALRAAGGDPVQLAAAARGHSRRQQVRRRGLAVPTEKAKSIYHRGSFSRLQGQRRAILADAENKARGYALFRDRRGPVQIIPFDDGRAARLVNGVRGKESYPPYHVTDAQLARFESLYPAGFDGQGGDYVQGSYMGRKRRPGYHAWAVFHPDGLALPKATRGKAEIQPMSAPEPVAAPNMPAAPENVASGPDIAPAPAIEPVTAPADLPPPAPVPVPAGYPIPHAPAIDVAPDDLAATVAGLVATVAALQARLDAMGAATVADSSIVAPAADDLAERLAAAEARADALAAELAAAKARIATQAAWIQGAAVHEEKAAAIIADLSADVERWKLAWATVKVRRTFTARRLQSARAATRAARADAQAWKSLAGDTEARTADLLAKLAASEASRADLAHALARARVAVPLAGVRYVAPGAGGGLRRVA